MTEPTIESAARPRPYGAPYVLALAVIDGPDLHLIYRLKAAETVVGRDPVSHFVLNDAGISNRHIKIEVSGAIYTLVDLGSKNGTTLNTRRMAPNGRQKLKHLDEIQIGETRLLFMVNKFIVR